MLEDAMSSQELEQQLQHASAEEQFLILENFFGYPKACQSAEDLLDHIQSNWSNGHYLWLLSKLASLGVDWASSVHEISLKNVEKIPDVFDDFPELRHLDLAGGFDFIPESIGSLRHLLSLKLKGNFSFLPSALGRLKYLSQIELGTDRLDYIPESALWLFSHPEVECRLYSSSIDDATARKMKAVVCLEAGSVEVLTFSTVIAPSILPGHIRVAVQGIGVNRADILQRKGLYPPPKQARAEILGLEYAGEIVEVGPDVTRWKVGDRVMGIVAGGAYAEQVVVHAMEAMPIPSNLDSVLAAAIPEAFLTAYDALFLQANVQMGDRVLIHAIGSGVGNAGMQLCQVMGATVVGTSRTQDKVQQALQAGLNEGIWVRDGKFSEKLTAPVDRIMDFVGATYWDENISALRVGGEMIVVGLLGGRKVEVDLGALLRKRLQIRGTVLRSRSLDEKIQLAQKFTNQVLPLFEQGKLTPSVDVVFPLQEVAKAHVFMESNKSFGKIILRLED